MEPFEKAVEALFARVEQDPVQAIQEYWMNLADLDIDASPESIAEVIVDHQSARGDYRGCSSELEIAHQEYLGWAYQALGGKPQRW